jgi:hypothetical protein
VAQALAGRHSRIRGVFVQRPVSTLVSVVGGHNGKTEKAKGIAGGVIHGIRTLVNACRGGCRHRDLLADRLAIHDRLCHTLCRQPLLALLVLSYFLGLVARQTAGKGGRRNAQPHGRRRIAKGRRDATDPSWKRGLMSSSAGAGQRTSREWRCVPVWDAAAPIASGRGDHTPDASAACREVARAGPVNVRRGCGRSSEGATPSCASQHRQPQACEGDAPAPRKAESVGAAALPWSWAAGDS